MRSRAFTLLLLLASGGIASAEERLNRGLVAVTGKDGKQYLGWRLLKGDAPNAAFNVYRQTGGGRPVKVNAQPVAGSTNLVDADARVDQPNTWFVRPVAGGRELAASESVSLPANSPPDQVFTIKLQGNYAANKVAI